MSAQSPKGREGRVDYRIDLAIQVRYRIAQKVEGRYRLSDFFNGLGENFSGGGAAFKLARDLPKGTFIYLEMLFPFDRFPVSAVAEVLRTKDATLKGKKVRLCITRFLLMSPTIHDKMVSYIIGEGARQQRAKEA